MLLRLLCFGLGLGLAQTQDLPQPHIIFILADDLGWNDVGFHGSNQVPTPNIDALAYNGVILNRYYTQHICTPSRAALLTGNYPIRSGYQGYPLRAGENRTIPDSMATLPSRLKELGYKTHLVGKWHLGHGYRRSLPTGKGFDSHYGYWSGYIGYFDHLISGKFGEQVVNGLDLHRNLTPNTQDQGLYATSLFNREALRIIEDHDNSYPLFLMLSHLAAHTGKNGTELEVPDIDYTNSRYSYIEDPERRKFADIVNLMDDSVGQIVTKLKERNMLENSIVIFSNDNGAETEGTHKNSGSNWPLRGLKYSLHEGGVRGVGVIFSPLLEQRSYVYQGLMHITDWLPTLYDFAGGDVSSLGKIDGISQLEAISWNEPSPRENILLNIDESEGYSGYISGFYKLLNGTYENGDFDQYFGETGRQGTYDRKSVLFSEVNIAINGNLSWDKIDLLRNQIDLSSCRSEIEKVPICSKLCLFDLEKDPCETTDIAEKNPFVVKQMERALLKFQDELVPQQNTIVDLESNPNKYGGTWCTWLDEEGCPRNNAHNTKQQYLLTLIAFISTHWFRWGLGH